MKKQNRLISERFFHVTFIVSLLLLAAAVLLPVWRLFPEITQSFAIPLHYNVHSGVDLFGPWQRIFTIPIISGIILVINTVLAFIFWNRDHVISRMLILVALVCQIFAVVAMVFVVLLNLSYV